MFNTKFFIKSFLSCIASYSISTFVSLLLFLLISHFYYISPVAHTTPLPIRYKNVNSESFVESITTLTLPTIYKNEKYDLNLYLTVPWDEYNQELGNFMIEFELWHLPEQNIIWDSIKEKHELVYSGFQSVLLPKIKTRSFPFNLLPPLPFISKPLKKKYQYKVENDLLFISLPLLQSSLIYDSYMPTHLYIKMSPSYNTKGGNSQLLQLEEASIGLEMKLSGFVYLFQFYYWSLMVYFVFGLGGIIGTVLWIYVLIKMALDEKEQVVPAIANTKIRTGHQRAVMPTPPPEPLLADDISSIQSSARIEPESELESEPESSVESVVEQELYEQEKEPEQDLLIQNYLSAEEEEGEHFEPEDDQDKKKKYEVFEPPPVITSAPSRISPEAIKGWFRKRKN